MIITVTLLFVVVDANTAIITVKVIVCCRGHQYSNHYSYSYKSLSWMPIQQSLLLRLFFVVEGANTAIITVTVIVRCRGCQYSDHYS
ncbi:MAG: hypothetical protein ACRC0O_06300 [Vibrio metschnikovii]